MNRVLLYRPGGLGDLIVGLPSIRLLRRLHPRAALHLAARRGCAAVLSAAGVIDGILDPDDRAWAPFFSEGGADPVSLPGGAPSALWSWFLKPPPASFSRAAALLPGGSRILVADPRRGLPLSRDWFEQTAAAAGATVTDGDFEDCARLPPIMPKAEVPFGRPFAVVHPGSGGLNKRWPFDRFLSLIGVLADRGIPGMLVTGPAEENDEAGRGRGPLPPGWRRYPSPHLAELAGWLSACLLYIGNDSGVTHLAAAAGARTLAFFLDEHLPAWKPFGRATVLRAGRIDGIALEKAREEVLAHLPG